jgi:hypothetical protein
MKKIILGLLAAALGVGGWLLWREKQTLVGGPTVQLAVSSSQEFLSEWGGLHAKQSIALPHLPEAYPGQLIYIAFVVNGFSVDEKQKTDLTGDFLVISPAGRTIVHNKQVNQHQMDMAGFGSSKYLLMTPATGLTIDPGDPTGEYILRGVVRDRNSGKKGIGEHILTLKSIQELLRA